MYFIKIAMLLTSVLVFYSSQGWGLGEMSTCAPLASKLADAKSAEDRNYLSEQLAKCQAREKGADECKDLKEKIQDNLSKITKACSAYSKDCVKNAKACSIKNSEENDGSTAQLSSLFQSSLSSSLGFNAAGMNLDATRDKCDYLSKTQWEDEKKTARSKLEDVKKDTEKIRKDLDEIQEKKGEKQSSIMEKMNDLVKDAQEAQEKEAKAGRDEQADFAKQTSTLMGAIRKGHSDIIRANQRKAQMIAQRAMFMIESDIALQKSKCMKSLQDAYSKYMGKKTITSTITGAGINSSSGKGALNQEYQACVRRAEEMRTQTLENYNYELKAIDEDIKNLNAAIADLNQELSLQKQNQQADAQSRETKKAQMEQNFMRSQQKLIADFQLAEQAAQKKTQSATYSLIQKQMDAAEASNTIFNIGKKAPASDDTPADALGYASKARSLYFQGTSNSTCAFASDSELTQQIEALKVDGEK